MKKNIPFLIVLVIMLNLLTACHKKIESYIPDDGTSVSADTQYDFTYPNETDITQNTNFLTESSQSKSTAETAITTDTVQDLTTVAFSESTVSEVTTIPTETTVNDTTKTSTVNSGTTVAIETVTVQTTTIPSAIYNPSNYTPLNYSNQVGMWISFLEFQNILKGKSEAEFRASVCKMYDDCVSLGVNTVYVHARSHGDAFYSSDLYPWSKNITGVIDGTPSFDPYKILIDEAHKRGLSFHAWINPMRTVTESDMNKLSDSYKIKNWSKTKNGTYIVNVNGTYWLSPAYKEVRQLIVDGAKEIVSKYNVDGIHIDDYFYQSSFTSSFDKSAFNSSGYSDLSKFRLDTINLMVKELYSGVKSVNPSVLFGISPAGNIDNLYAYHYADVKTWCSQQGYCDYIIPQIYWGFTHKSAAYDKVLAEWCSIHTNKNVKLIVGLAAYRAANGEMASEQDILAKQVSYFKNEYPSHYSGVAFFRYENLFKPSSDEKNKIENELKALKSQLK